MTDYDNLVFTFLWCDVAKQVSMTHKWIQERSLHISDVGRRITMLCSRLRDNYPKDSEMPEMFPVPDGFASHIMHEFWGKDYYESMYSCDYC